MTTVYHVVSGMATIRKGGRSTDLGGAAARRGVGVAYSWRWREG
jgi:hypothetical protein